MRMSPITKTDLPSTSNTRDIGIDPMSVEKSITEVTRPSNRPDPKATTDEGITTYFSGRTHPDGTPSAFQTANEVLITCRPCAGSTQKQEVITIDSKNSTNNSTKSTRGSRLEPPPAVEDEPISHEQLKFTETISKAMSRTWHQKCESGPNSHTTHDLKENQG